MKTRGTETVEPLPPDDGLASLPAGTLLAGRFELAGVIGSGGYATVYEALDRELGRRVAIKVLRQDRVTPSSLARMRREVAVARDVTSARLVKLFDITEDAGHTFVSMELVDGESLRERIERGPLPLDEVIDIAHQILDALATLHANGIIHRDLKPANILLTRTGEVKLVDFGLARHWQNEQMRVTQTEGLVGTMEYLSPEQALGRDLDPRSDLYSFGVVLFEMLSGELPFGGESSLGTVVAHITTHAPDVRRSRAELPLWLSLLVQKLLEKDRAHRPESADAVHRALAEQRIDWSYRWKRSRGRTLTISLLLVVLAASGVWGWSTWWSRLDRIESDTANVLRARDRRGRVLWSRAGAQVERRATVVRLTTAERRVAVVPRDDDAVPDVTATASRPILLLDPQSGRETARIPLPLAPTVFPVERSFNLSRLLAVDLDHDGREELIASYVHYYWPSYAVLVDPETARAGTVFYASGHHRPLGTIDLDGDGRDELLFSGPNNRMGWRDGVAAVRARFAPEGEVRVLAASTPDAFYSESDAPLLWYALLPRKRVYGTALANVDRQARTFDLVNDDGSRVTLGFDGFLSGSGGDSAARQAARTRAYVLLREAQLRESLGELDRAVELALEARRAAVAAGETELAGWLSTLTARVHARVDGSEQTRQTIESILQESDGGPELCWEVARVYSEHGNARLAADWFERALTLTPREWLGHPPADYLTEAVVSLVEIEQWQEALDLIDRFIDGYTHGHAEALRARALVLWRTRRPMSEAIPFTPGIHWLHNYWALEHAWATDHPDPNEFLERLRRELKGTEATPWIRSIEAEVLFRLGRTDEALPIVRQAWTSVTADPTDATARIHRGVVETRLKEIEAAAAARQGTSSQTP